MKLFKILSLVVVVLTLSLSTVIAAEEKATGVKEPFWAERCDKTKKADGPKRGRCEISQSLVVKQNNQRFAEMAVSYPEGKAKARGVVIAPLGILLQAGMTMKIDDGKPFKFQARYCDVSGCHAFVDLSEEILDTMRNGKKITISFHALNQKQINVQMSLEGFGKALKGVS